MHGRAEDGPAGTLESINAAELLEILTIGAMSGSLHLEREDEAATLGPLQGESVLRRIQAWRKGSFRFIPGTIQ